MTFATPSAPGDGIKLANHLGALVIIEVLEYRAGIETTVGISDAIRANVSVVEGPGAGDTYEDTLVFGKKIVGQLRSDIGKKILGRIAQGQAQPGKTAPWQINGAATDAERAADEAKAHAFERAQSPLTAAAAPPF